MIASLRPLGRPAARGGRHAPTFEAARGHREFVKRFPRIGEAWELVSKEGERGPFDEKTRRLVKLAVAIGALREGAVHSAVRKAVGAGARRAEVEQVVALAANTIGLPSAVAAWTWAREQVGRRRP